MRGNKSKIETKKKKSAVEECEGMVARPLWQLSSLEIEVILIVSVIDSQVNVMLWQRAAIISVLRLTAR